MLPRGCSSAGRALESHSRGQGFESPQLHRATSAIRGSSLTREREDDLEGASRGAASDLPERHASGRVPMRDFSSDPDRQANIAFALIVLGIIFVGGLTIWLFYGAQF